MSSSETPHSRNTASVSADSTGADAVPPPEPNHADQTAMHTVGERSWHHSLADVIGALLGAGLVLESLREFPYCAWKVVAGCEVVERFSSSHAYYGRPVTEPQLPLMFSIRARKR